MTEDRPDRLAEVSRRIDFPTIRRYGELTADPNPIHTDRDFAAKTEMGGIIAHGTLCLNLIWQSICQTFGLDAAAGATLDIRFTAPVREDDVITAGGALAAEGEGGRYDVWAVNEAGQKVIGGTLLLRQPG